MYQSIYVDRFRKTTYLRDDIEGWIVEEFKPYCFQKDPNGKFTSLFDDKCKKIYHRQFEKGDSRFLEQDVRPELRVLTDKYLHEESVAKNHRMLYYDIETEIIGKLTKEYVKEAKAKITSVALYDAFNDVKYVLVIDKKGRQFPDSEKLKIYSFRNEKYMLHKFLEIWEEIDPTISITFNGDFFDNSYIYYRIKSILGMEDVLRLSPINIITENDRDDDKPIKIQGMESLDYMRLYKKYVTKELEGGHSLDNIAKSELGYGKIQYNGSLNDLYENDIDKFIEYNLNDVMLMVDLEKKLGFIELTLMICHFAHTNYETIYKSSVVLEGAIFTHLKRKGIVCPNKPITEHPEINLEEENLEDVTDDDDDDDVIIVNGKKKKKKFVGGWVMSPKVGRHNYLSTLDISSSYPNGIMSLNIGVETMVGRVIDDEMGSYQNMSSEEFVLSKLSKRNRMYKIELPNGERHKVHSKDLYNYIIENDFSISPNGIMFRNDKKSAISEILQEWTEKRTYYKGLMKESRKKGEFSEALFYDRFQEVFKRFNNSVYGALALSSFFMSDLNKWLVTATTMTGQRLIKGGMETVNEKMNAEIGTEGINYSLYTDTDSLFIAMLPITEHRYGKLDLDDEKLITPYIRTISDEIRADINAYYDKLAYVDLNCKSHSFNIKPEYIIKTALFLKKKQYGFHILEKEGTPIEKGHEYIFKGLTLIKSNFPKSFRKISKELFIDILDNKPKDLIDEKILDFKDFMEDADVDEIALPVKLKQVLDKYIDKGAGSGNIFSKTSKGALSQFKASIRYNDLLKFYGLNKTIPEITIGESIKYVYLTNNPYNIDSLAYKYGDDNPPEIMKLINKYVDRDKNFDNQLLKKLQTLYDTLSWGSINLNRNKLHFFKNRA